VTQEKEVDYFLKHPMASNVRTKINYL